jgi:hypothetical protein
MNQILDLENDLSYNELSMIEKELKTKKKDMKKIEKKEKISKPTEEKVIKKATDVKNSTEYYKNYTHEVKSIYDKMRESYMANLSNEANAFNRIESNLKNEYGLIDFTDYVTKKVINESQSKAVSFAIEEGMNTTDIKVVGIDFDENGKPVSTVYGDFDEVAKHDFIFNKEEMAMAILKDNAKATFEC